MAGIEVTFTMEYDKAGGPSFDIEFLIALHDSWGI
jgi:hypothetical protein